MVLNPYTNTINSDDGNTYLGLPADIVLPSDSSKYITMPWLPQYTPQMLADLVYGDASLYWLIMVANGIVNPYLISVGDEIKVLLPDYINTVQVKS